MKGAGKSVYGAGPSTLPSMRGLHLAINLIGRGPRRSVPVPAYVERIIIWGLKPEPYRALAHRALEPFPGDPS